MELVCVIKEYLKENGLKSKYVAEKAGVSETTFSHIINNKSLPTLPVAFKIAKVIGKRVDELWLVKS
ncbi:helix-turn-helix transcriptional regulator [Fictibacillus enclensis]|nr:helix-turn-helix transcriptional regulator [Fictibacillus enclensis]